MNLRKLDDFSEGDGFNSPRISGFDVIYERIAIDMDMNPEKYRDIEHDLFDRYEAFPKEFQREMQEYLENWIEEEYNFWTEYADYLREYA